MPQKFAMDTMSALEKFNSDHGTAWSLGTNWSNVDTDFETFVNKYLFPKINETALVEYELGNRFDWLFKEDDKVAQYSEEYVILDAIPVGMNLTKPQTQMLLTNFPKMATKLFAEGQYKKMKFTLNYNDTRLNFSTLQDGIGYAIAVYKKRISDINLSEESETKGMIIDYATNNVNEVRTVTSLQELGETTFRTLLNLQNNSSKFNECNSATGGSVGRFTTQTKLDKICILTTDTVKSYLLDTKIANTFENKGIDFTDKIISFEDLGGVYKLTDTVTISEADTIAKFRAYGDYQIEIGDILPVDTVFTFDISDLSEFDGKFVEVKPDSDLFAYVFDIRKLRLKRNTKGMLKSFENPEFGNVNHWLHYYSKKQVSPFYNSVVIKEG